MIEISHLTKKYGDHTAVDDLNLTIEPGRIYGFLGPNGAGKSTTMNMITGYIGATEGTVKINGFDIFEQPEEAKKCVGYLPEIPPLYVDMTVKEYLTFAAQLKGIDKSRLKSSVGEAMEMTKIREYENRLIKNLSKGYRQRVGLSQAILGFPDVIILDEPTVGLDPMQIIEIRALIRELGKKHTVILSSHILSEVSEVCNYVFIISKGKLVASDTTENLTRMMSGAQCVELLLHGAKENVLGFCKKMPDMDQYHISDTAEADEFRVEIKAKDGCDIRSAVNKLARDCELEIYTMNVNEKSLEDVFLELTENAQSDILQTETSHETEDETIKSKTEHEAIKSETKKSAVKDETIKNGEEEA